MCYGNPTQNKCGNTISNRLQIPTQRFVVHAKNSNESDKFMLLCLSYNFQNHWIGIILPLNHLCFFYLLSSLRLNIIVDSALKQHLAKNGKSRKLFKVSLFHVLRAYASWWYTAAEFKLLNLKWRSHFVKIQTSWAHLCISDCVVWNVWLLRLMYDALA